MNQNVTIIGAWEVGYSYPLLEAEHWRYPLRDFGVTEWIMSPVTGINVPELVEVNHMLPELHEQQERGRTIVFVDEKGEADIRWYKHPEEACYVFGKASFSPLRAYGDVLTHDSIMIPTPVNSGLLWAHQAAVLTLYDREVKRGRHGD